MDEKNKKAIAAVLGASRVKGFAEPIIIDGNTVVSMEEYDMIASALMELVETQQNYIVMLQRENTRLKYKKG